MPDIIEFASNNALLVSGLMASALAVIFYELKLKAQTIASLSIPLAVRMINDGGAIIDVRSSEQFLNGHIIDSSNVPEATLLESPDGHIAGKNNVLLVCATGSGSGGAVSKLRKAGHENVFSIRGGIEEWRRENLPLVDGTR
jgi:rhodanese-related sulfurtransferase